MSARDEILRRVRSALTDVEPDPDPVAAPRGAAPADLVSHFAERVADYRATVVRCTADEVGAAVAAALPAGARVVVPPGLPEVVAARLSDVRVDDGLSAAELDQVDAVITGCRVAVAETGTIVLDHAPGQGRRALTLVPDRHVCVVRADQVVADVPDAVAALDPGRPLTWISGPSATSDIELDRVEGVHGPRVLHVIVVGEIEQQ
ncbi:LutC/YkgG family protein [Nocardioides bizhenqiangii]|uniref:LUD domain-containing protein n=1 Tax=Nocardioides bizhenqiangii TaxID=3095076 RepID=A0ABZ0ZPI1_9ACTN|nr:LUD domain-containing protein [Nocardioides sp. HM61]WQQ26276.1 LUD domain-containing protein [Nocardioides sp. HM61]